MEIVAFLSFDAGLSYSRVWPAGVQPELTDFMSSWEFFIHCCNSGFAVMERGAVTLLKEGR